MRKQFHFPVSTHMLNGCDPDGTIGKILRDFDVYDQVKFKPLQNIMRWIDPVRGIDTNLPVGIDAYVEKLCSLYPHEEDGIREFHSKFYPLAKWVIEYEKKRGLSKIVHVVKSLPILWTLLSLRRKTAADILDPLVKDPACREIMTIMTSLFGIHYTELDAAIFVSVKCCAKDHHIYLDMQFSLCLNIFVLFLKVMGSLLFHASGAYYPKGGSSSLTKALAQRFVEYGGDLYVATNVESIEFNKDAIATGVTMKDEQGNAMSKTAKSVIHCSDLSKLVNKLVPSGTFPEYYLRKVLKHIPGRSLVVAWAGLDIDINNDKGITDFEILQTNNMCVDNALLEDITRNANYSTLPISGVTIYSNIDPDCCEPGKSLISTNFMASYDTFAKTLDADGKRGVKYQALKNKVKEQLLDQMVKATGIDDLADYVEVLEMATPITLQRYTGNMQGSYMGWKPIPSQGAFSSFSPRTPIRNLFQGGQWLGIGGVANAMTSGIDAARLATRYLKRMETGRTSDNTEKRPMDIITT